MRKGTERLPDHQSPAVELHRRDSLIRLSADFWVMFKLRRPSLVPMWEEQRVCQGVHVLVEFGHSMGCVVVWPDDNILISWRGALVSHKDGRRLGYRGAIVPPGIGRLGGNKSTSRLHRTTLFHDAAHGSVPRNVWGDLVHHSL